MAFPSLTTSMQSVPLDSDGEIDDVILRTPTDAGYEQTRPRFTRARRSWGCNYAAMSDADLVTLRAYEITTLRNGADSFDWTHPTSGTHYTVRLAGPIKYAKNIVLNLTAVSFLLREV